MIVITDFESISHPLTQCLWCGNVFKAYQVSSHKYCSPQCRTDAHNDKYRKKRIEETKSKVYKWQSNPQLFRQFTNIEKAWLAGVVDCEGWIGVCKTGYRKIKKGYYQSHYPAVAVGNTDKRLIDKILEVTQVGFIVEQKRKIKNKNHKDVWIWKVTGENAQYILFSIKEYLIIKGKQADIVMQYPPKGIIAPDFKKQLYEKIKILNQRGVING